MAKYVIIGDLHVKYTAPVFRKPTYFQELISKIDQINTIAKENNAKVICLGDFFNSYVEDYFESIMYELANRIYGWTSLVGNHDCKDVEGNLRGTSFGILEKMDYIRTDSVANIDFFHYYNREKFTGKSKNKIALIHDYIMPSGTKENFEYKECFENDYRIVLAGHYHFPFDKTIGQTRYINPGSLMRSTIKELQLKRTPEVILLDDTSLEIKHIPLKVKPLEDVSNPLEENKLDKTFESKFVDMLLKNDLTGSNNDIISLLQKNNIDKNIVEYIKGKIDEVK